MRTIDTFSRVNPAFKVAQPLPSLSLVGAVDAGLLTARVSAAAAPIASVRVPLTIQAMEERAGQSSKWTGHRG